MQRDLDHRIVRRLREHAVPPGRLEVKRQDAQRRHLRAHIHVQKLDPRQLGVPLVHAAAAPLLWHRLIPIPSRSPHPLAAHQPAVDHELLHRIDVAVERLRRALHEHGLHRKRMHLYGHPRHAPPLGLLLRFAVDPVPREDVAQRPHEVRRLHLELQERRRPLLREAVDALAGHRGEPRDERRRRRGLLPLRLPSAPLLLKVREQLLVQALLERRGDVAPIRPSVRRLHDQVRLPPRRAHDARALAVLAAPDEQHLRVLPLWGPLHQHVHHHHRRPLLVLLAAGGWWPKRLQQVGHSRGHYCPLFGLLPRFGGVVSSSIGGIVVIVLMMMILLLLPFQALIARRRRCG